MQNVCTGKSAEVAADTRAEYDENPIAVRSWSLLILRMALARSGSEAPTARVRALRRESGAGKSRK